MKKVSDYIKAIRKEKGLTRDFVANKLSMELSSYGKIERGEVGISLERLYAIAAAFNMSAIDILSYDTDNQVNVVGNITYIPVKAKAGSLAEIYDKINPSDIIRFNLPFFREKELYMIDAEGDSMPPVNNGDYIILKRLYQLSEVKYGCAYVLETKDEDRVFKRVHTDKDENKLLLKSNNSMYEPYTISKNNLLNLWEFKGYLSKDIVLRNYNQQKINELESKLQFIERGLNE